MRTDRVGSQQQPHMPYGINEKRVCHHAPSRSAGLSDASRGLAMRQFSTPCSIPASRKSASSCCTSRPTSAKIEDVEGIQAGLLFARKALHLSQSCYSLDKNGKHSGGAFCVQGHPSMKKGRTPSRDWLDRWIGRRFGRWTVISFHSFNNNNTSNWKCRCDCGNTRLVRNNNLLSGHSLSCGCLQKEVTAERATTHGKSRSRIYHIWGDMVKRCTNDRHKAWRHYGGRGIVVCERWLDFENFLSDMGEPQPGLTIERINNDGNYEPGNCRWATQAEQLRNRRNNRRITINGVTRVASEWAREYGISRQVIDHRLKAGWSDEDAVIIPLRKHGKREVQS